VADQHLARRQHDIGHIDMPCGVRQNGCGFTAMAVPKAMRGSVQRLGGGRGDLIMRCALKAPQSLVDRHGADTQLAAQYRPTQQQAGGELEG
jgi:hypothetical protein